MKKLVLGSLLLAALVSQTTGCIITSDGGDDFATMDAEWSFVEVDTTGRAVATLPCPAGFDTVALHNQQFDPATDRDIGVEIVDVFDCVDATNFTDELEPGVYETFLSVTSPGGANVYARSVSAVVDVTDADATFETQFIDNGGYFRVDWDLRRGATPVGCADVGGVEIEATLVNTTAGIVDIFPCEWGFGYSAGVMEGTYTVKLNALNTSDQAIGSGPTLINKTMGVENDIVDLGVNVIDLN
jgi:hypothetical protein